MSLGIRREYVLKNKLVIKLELIPIQELPECGDRIGVKAIAHFPKASYIKFNDENLIDERLCFGERGPFIFSSRIFQKAGQGCIYGRNISAIYYAEKYSDALNAATNEFYYIMKTLDKLIENRMNNVANAGEFKLPND